MERCGRESIALTRVSIDSELAAELGLTEGKEEFARGEKAAGPAPTMRTCVSDRVSSVCAASTDIPTSPEFPKLSKLTSPLRNEAAPHEPSKRVCAVTREPRRAWVKVTGFADAEGDAPARGSTISRAIEQP